MKRNGKVYYQDVPAGAIYESEEGYVFQYDKEYLQRREARPVSLSLPLRIEPFVSNSMFAFFDGLIPEGWLLDIAQQTWKIDLRDRMGLLLACCKDCIGAVSVVPMEKDDQHE